MIQQIKVTKDDEKKRLDIFLSESTFKEKSRSYVQNLIKDEHVLVNNQTVKTG